RNDQVAVGRGRGLGNDDLAKASRTSNLTAAITGVNGDVLATDRARKLEFAHLFEVNVPQAAIEDNAFLRVNRSVMFRTAKMAARFNRDFVPPARQIRRQLRHEKEFSCIAQRTIRQRPGRGGGGVYRRTLFHAL